MTVIRPNSISGINSITGNGGDISIFRADGSAADVTVNNITSGVITATTFSGNITGNLSGGTINATSGTVTGNLGVGGVLTYEDVTNIDSVGVITARDGLRVTGIATVGSLEITDGTTKISKHAVGVGTTTTAGRNAGVSTAIGTVNFNSTLGKLEFYNGSKWLQITDNRFKVASAEAAQSTFGNYTLFAFTSNGTFTVTGSDSIDILVVGGGGQGGMPNASSNYGGGGGAGGLVWYTGFNVAEGEYSVIVGAGGPTNTSGSGSRRGLDGSDSTAFGLTAKGGGGGGGQGGTPPGRSGGSGGGGGFQVGGAAGGAATQPSQSNSLASGTLTLNLGNAGGAGNSSPNGGGGGGGAGGAGDSGTGSGNPVHGGAGYNMSSHLGTALGDNGWFSGGGGGVQQTGGSYTEPYGNGGNGLYGGGGRGARYNTNTQTTGTANTGGGGGGGSSNLGGRGGGSGVVIIRVLTSLLN